MSTAVMVLPRVWGMASLESAAREMAQPRVAERKGPQRLYLVSAMTAEPARAAVASMPRVSRGGDRELAFYRKYTEALLRRYLKLSMESGRVPSMLGQEMFRGKVTSYRVRSFEDVVIFVHDVEKCLDRLDAGQRYLVRRIALEEYTQGETAAMLGISLRTVIRRYTEAIDKLTRVLLELKMLEPLTACRDMEP